VNVQGRPSNGVRDMMGQLKRTTDSLHKLTTDNADMTQQLYQFFQKLSAAVAKLNQRVQVAVEHVIPRARALEGDEGASSMTGAQLLNVCSEFQSQFDRLSETVQRCESFRATSVKRSASMDRYAMELRNERSIRLQLEERVAQLEQASARQAQQIEKILAAQPQPADAADMFSSMMQTSWPVPQSAETPSQFYGDNSNGFFDANQCVAPPVPASKGDSDAVERACHMFGDANSAESSPEHSPCSTSSVDHHQPCAVEGDDVYGELQTYLSSFEAPPVPHEKQFMSQLFADIAPAHDIF
jgi:hypothetical protein